MQQIKMAKKNNLTLNEAKDLFIRKCRVNNLSIQTIQMYEDKLKKFLIYVGGDSLVMLRPLDK